MSVVAHLRFYEELNDFLPPERRKREFALRCAESATVKNAIESVGVPHTEVELILANGESVDFGHRVQEGERISVYPMFEAFDVRPLLKLRPAPLREPRFIADAQLGGLARLLRMLGFDTLFDNHAADADIRRCAAEERRTILTRDRQLLICRDVTHGCFVHAIKPPEQLREIAERLQLAGSALPFTRCLCCNAALEVVDKSDVLERLPPAVAARQTRFMRCPGCDRVYWPGSHYERMDAMLSDLVARV
ncbi:MAG TPA: Mut7-C RNAse domain-containing protein [Albitalea sp.]|uniref:Mut7-C RNAse domain-containing protein n=1 Tax=Piscinibacter sp. TaxID=1903157 RepID=UPI002ED64C58